MLKLKLNCVMLLGTFLFSSCGSLPVKPKIEICAHDQVNLEVECYDNQTQDYRTLPIETTDKYIMFSPDDWGLVLLYIEKLRGRLGSSKSNNDIEKIISRELKKIIETSNLLASPDLHQ